MSNKKNKSIIQQHYYILNNEFKDVLPLIFFRLDLKDKKNIRLTCNKFRFAMDNNYVFNLMFHFNINKKMDKQNLEMIIKQYPNLNSFKLNGLCNNGDLIKYIPNYIINLELYDYDIEFEFSTITSLKSLAFVDCDVSLTCWNSIPSSLSSLIYGNTRIKKPHTKFVILPLNLKKLYISCIILDNLTKFPENLTHLTLENIFISVNYILKFNIKTLIYLKFLNIEFDLKNFKTHCYNINNYFPYSSSLRSLILDTRTLLNLYSYLSLPISLFHLEVKAFEYLNLNCNYESTYQSNYILCLLQNKNKLPFLNYLKISFGKNKLNTQIIPKFFNHYNQLKILEIVFMIPSKKSKIDNLLKEFYKKFEKDKINYIKQSNTRIKICIH